MPKKQHKQMDRTSAAQAEFLDRKREAQKRNRQKKFMTDRFGSARR